MLETILKLYTAVMLGDVRSPIPHIVGPPGCGKSTFAEQAADLLGVRLHVINVSRISPLELEGVQMPDTQHEQLNLLTAIFWTRMKDGDICLLDEFLRGFPEVYNGLLDILTSHQVGGFRLPKVFFIAASNSTIAYDKALEDRLLNIPVPDPRRRKTEKQRIAKVICEAIGLLPVMAESYEMQDLLDTEVLPMYEMLDAFKSGRSLSTAEIKGTSPRKLIGQARLRQVQSDKLVDLITFNNVEAIKQGKDQYVVLLDGRKANPAYVKNARQLQGNPRLTPIQAVNLELNMQLIGMEEVKSSRKETDDDDDTDPDIFA